MNLGALSVIFATFLWALDTLIRYPLLGSGVSAAWIVSVEHLLLSLIFLPILFRSKNILKGLDRKDWASLILIGAGASALGTLAFTQAFLLLNPSLVILLQKFQPLFAIFLAFIVLKEKISWKFLFWALPCVLGGILLSFEDIVLGLNSKTEKSGQLIFVGYLLTLFTVICWASATVFGKRLMNKGLSIGQLTSLRFVIGMVFLIPFLGHELSTPSFYLYDLAIWAKLAVMVIISGVLGMVLYYFGLARIKARLCALLELFFPFSAVVVNWVFLGVALSFWQLLGAALLLLGSTVLQLKRY